MRGTFLHFGGGCVVESSSVCFQSLVAVDAEEDGCKHDKHSDNAQGRDRVRVDDTGQ